MLLMGLLARINFLIIRIWPVSLSVRTILCAVQTYLTHKCIFCHLGCLYSCTASTEVHHCKGPDIWYLKEHWQPSCCMAVWQFPTSCCSGLTGISAALTQKRMKGSFVSFLIHVSLWAQYCKAGRFDYDLCLTIICLMLCLVDSVQNAEQETAPARLFQEDWINHAEGWK